MKQPLILTGNLKKDVLSNVVIIITGAGQGIGYEAARSLAYLGAKVIIAEINSEKGKQAAVKINRELSKEVVSFIKTDVSQARSIHRLEKKVIKKFGRVDAIINNATIAPFGSVENSDIKDWDLSYGVNFRGPVLLAKTFLPHMIKNNSGIFLSVSSEGLAYMGPYESMKAAQVHLARTIDAELEGTEVISFSIGPGFVPTETASTGIQKLAKLYGKSDEELHEMYKDHIITAEAAGAGFATSIALASQFKGQEIGAKQALILAGIEITSSQNETVKLNDQDFGMALDLCSKVRRTLIEQSEGWKERPIFERQWVVRDFKKNAGMAAEQWLDTIEKLENAIANKNAQAIQKLYLPIDKLVNYYGHLQYLARGYVKNKGELEKQLVIIKEWQEEAKKLDQIINKA